jgi:hypothetical protein
MPTVTLASANRVQLCYVPESSFGDVPVVGTPYNLRMTGESLNFDVSKENDKEINSAAQMTSVSTVSAQASGDIKVHMQYGEYDRFFASTLRSTWAAYGTNGVGTVFTGSVTAGTLGTVASVITASAAPTTTSAFTTLKPGQWFKLNMPTSANDGKFVRVSTSVAPTTTTITLDVNTPLVLATAIANSSVATSRLTNGVTITPFSIERQISEVSQYMVFRGMYPSKFSTSFASGGLTEGTFSFIGKDMLRRGTTWLTGAPNASLAFDIQNAVSGVGNIWENGAPLASTFIKSLSMDLDSGLRAQDAIGTLGLVGVGIGTFMAKGSLEVYFADGVLFDKFLGDVFTSISFSTKDTAGNGYIITFPRVQLTSAKVMAGAKDSDLMASFEYTAYGDIANANAALRQTMFIDRVGAAVTP